MIEQIETPVTYVHGVANGMIEKIENSPEGASTVDAVKVAMIPLEGFGEYKG